MKCKKVISGEAKYADVTITIEINTSALLGRDESADTMDYIADRVMQVFPAIPHANIPLVRLKVR